jgi:hypothetical protein
MRVRRELVGREHAIERRRHDPERTTPSEQLVVDHVASLDNEVALLSNRGCGLSLAMKGPEPIKAHADQIRILIGPKFDGP